MRRLGYARYVAQGGDQGAAVTDAMGRQAPAGLLGIHLNFKSRSRPIIADTALSKAPARKRSATAWPTHPYGAITRDDWLDNSSLYWLTNTATSAARLYWQQAVTGKNFYAAANVSLPAAVTVLPQADLLQRSRTRRPLRRLGTTATAFRGAARGVPHTALNGSARNTIPRVRRHWHAPHRYQRVSAEAPCENLHKLLRMETDFSPIAGHVAYLVAFVAFVTFIPFVTV